MMSQDDQLDWFDKDEEDLVNTLKTKISEASFHGDNVEFIETLDETPLDDEAPQSFAIKSQPPRKMVSTAKLREIVGKKAIDAFLFVFSNDANFLSGQIKANDSIERVLLYMQVIVLIIKLEVPGFDELVLKSIAENEPLIQHFVEISKKIFAAKYKSMWSDLSKVDIILSNMEIILLAILQVPTPTKQYLQIISEISMLIRSSNTPWAQDRMSCISFGNTLDKICKEQMEQDKRRSDEIFPCLEELVSTDNKALENLEDISKQSLITKSYKNNDEYINIQKYLLREDFMISLRECVQSLKKSQKMSTLGNVFMENVSIVLNDNLMETNRDQLVFADLMGSSRALLDQELNTMGSRKLKLKIKFLKGLKSGTLLCFSTSFDFENLILATVSYTDLEKRSKGYLSVDIVKQYNIGSIYNKELIMVKSPAFFEPYHNVYNVLKTYTYVENVSIPMQDYIVGGKNVSEIPKYLKQNSSNVETKTKNGLMPNTVPLLNDSQQLAFEDAISKEFCLIQGPPGTGKTYLSVEIMKKLIQKTNSPIVLITYTNESLDKFLLKLEEHTESIVRFGIVSKHPKLDKYNLRNIQHTTAVNALIKKLHYDTKNIYKEDFGVLQKLYKDFDGTEESYKTIVEAQNKLQKTTAKLKTIKLFFYYELVKMKQVIAMTTTCAAKTNFLFKLLESPIVIFEEAAEVLESHIVGCLTSFTKQVIMIGDHKQLQPYTSSYQHSRVHEMNVSLFERLINRGMRNIVLKKQYRMRPEIVNLICPMIYDTLINAENVYQYPQVRGMQKNVFFLSHSNMECHDEKSSSRSNIYECKELLKLTEFLITKEGYAPHEVVLLSPYTKQIELISRGLLKIEKLSKIRAATVDSFQGIEADIVLLSLVRSNESNDIGFLGDQNRICVALSRAKIGLFIIGNMSFLSKCSKIWKKMQAQLSAQDAIGTEFPFAR